MASWIIALLSGWLVVLALGSTNIRIRICAASVIVCAIGGIIKAGFQDDSVEDKRYVPHLIWGIIIGFFGGALVAELAAPIWYD